MRGVAHAIVWLILLTGFSGCIADDDAGSETNPDAECWTESTEHVGHEI